MGGDATEAELARVILLNQPLWQMLHNDMTIAREEIFGPVVSGIPFDDMDEVIKQANQTEYGLGGGVCTTDIRKAHKVAHALKTGNVWINTYNITEPDSPFGGYKQSGLRKRKWCSFD